MTHDTDTAHTGRNDDGESLSKVTSANITPFEERNRLDADVVVLGYDSSYSSKDISTKTLFDVSRADKNITRHGGVRGRYVGTDEDSGGAIGFNIGTRGGGAVYTESASGRIGSVEWVMYPGDVPDKTTYDVRLRALAPGVTSRGVTSDPDRIESVYDWAVDKHEHHGVERPPEGKRRVERIEVDRGRHIDRPLVDLTRRVVAVDSVDRDEVVERAFDRVDRDRGVDRIRWRSNVPAIGNHKKTRDKDTFGSSTQNLRRAILFWVEDAGVTVVDDHA